MKTIKVLPAILWIALLGQGCNKVEQKDSDPVDYVNPYMGNISHLLVPTYPTVHSGETAEGRNACVEHPMLYHHRQKS